MSEEFVVNDRRLFGKDGQINAEPQAEEPAAAQDFVLDQSSAASEDERTSKPRPGIGAEPHLPPPTFPSLLVGLATSAFIHLGESPEPGQESSQVDLPAAKHAIDLLGVLKIKTKGNLESEEEALLETLLYDLRLKYVKASQ
jgi:hypothetical protein